MLNIMTKPFLLFLSLLVTTVCTKSDSVKHCDDYENRYLPLPLGSGIDGLTYGLSKENVINLYYLSCKTTPDKKFLVPDGVKITTSNYNFLYTEIFTTWKGYQPLTVELTQSYDVINRDISGTFNANLQEIKRQFAKGNSIIRVQLRKVLYDLSGGDGNYTDNFRTTMMKTVQHVANRDYQWASYYGNLLIQQFGTHTIKSVTIGGTFTVEYLFPTKFVNILGQSKLVDTAKREFVKAYNLTFDIDDDKVTRRDLNDFRKIILESRIIVHGGNRSYIDELQLVKKWEKSVVDFPAVIVQKAGDREDLYDFLPFFLYEDPDNWEFPMPETPRALYFATEQLLNEILINYYESNTYIGCTNVQAYKFALGANHDYKDHSCNVDFTSYFNFGGIYQTCTEDPNDNNFCSEFNQKNILTGDYSCPQNFYMVPLLENTIHKTINDDQTHYCVLHFEESQCIPKVPTVDVSYSSYWCANDDSTSNSNNIFGAKFGGVFTSTSVNPATGNKSCPDGYYEHKIGIDVNVCVGLDGSNSIVEFGGFFPDNPYTEKSNPICPRGYSQVPVGEYFRYCTGVNFYETSFPQLITPNTNISLRWEEASKETVIAVEKQFYSNRGHIKVYYYRDSSTSRWSTSFDDAPMRQSPILAELYDTWLATGSPTKTPTESDNDDNGAAMFSAPTYLSLFVTAVSVIRIM